MSSCEDVLKLYPPDGLVKDEFWQTKEDVEAVLMAAYKSFSQLDSRLFYYGELRADMLEDGGNLGPAHRNIMDSNIYPSNNWASWNSFYSVVNNCNLVLKYAPEVLEIDPTFTEYKFNTFNAEAVFLRSLAYFYLVRIWKDVPLVLTAYDSDSQDFFIEKTEGTVVLDTLKVQLNGILKFAPEDHETLQRTRGRATSGAVNALLADIALWEFNYQDCIDYVSKVDQSELYELLPGESWFSLFYEGNTLEGIFEIQFDSEAGQNNSMYNLTRPQSNNFIASDFAIELLSPEASREIIRGYGSVRENDKIIWKYVGQSADGLMFRSGNNLRSCNWTVYRLADLLLMKAEALSQMGRFDEALQIVNDIRIRAFMDPYTQFQQTPQAFEDMILEERAKELAFEGKRWFDLMRMGRRNDFARKDKLIEIIIENVPATQKRVLAAKLSDPNGWYLPVHSNEIENNINLVQNPYYQAYE
ncbi:MAG: RagB/SusD family nutrient uptake outer membrane protein [Bacteroidales bacterium]|nr:RagB/SusD family nutrient uptake outer membrane protein [Bacteroidales bacterium]